MSKNTKYTCPKCGSSVKAWADLDAKVTFDVSSGGKLTKQVISNNYQSDGRCGVKCSKCDWTDEEGLFSSLEDTALSKQASIDYLAAKRNS